MVLLLPIEVKAATASQPKLADDMQQLMRKGLTEKDALKQVAKSRNLGKSEVYREWQRTRHP
jgi:16S rRNA (cytidine1402-2'-O)-methyltransferase